MKSEATVSGALPEMSKVGGSYTDGAEDFVYLMDKCLLNYGGLIVLELFKSALPSSHRQRDQSITQPPPYEDVVQSAAIALGEYVEEDQMRSNSPAQTEDSPKPLSNPVQSSTSTVDRGPSIANEYDESNLRLRQHISTLKCNVKDDSSILPWSEVAGLRQVKMCLAEFATSFFHFSHLMAGLRHQSATGVLLFGPQGTGKTLLVKSFAQKYDLAFYDIRACAIMSKFVGESEKFVRALFEEVRANAPAILLLDECDGLLCNPAVDSSMSQSYRLLQNELKNQWSDLIYSKAKVIVVGATNKPHDIDMDGFGRRLSLKLHVGLPDSQSCQQILEGALARVRHDVEDIEIIFLGDECAARGLSGFDIDCVVEGLIRKGLREIILSKWFKASDWESKSVMIPCTESETGAQECNWESIEDKSCLSYRLLSSDKLSIAINKARPTVDIEMIERHKHFASRYCTETFE